jgi:hypothetical protein
MMIMDILNLLITLNGFHFNSECGKLSAPIQLIIFSFLGLADGNPLMLKRVHEG